MVEVPPTLHAQCQESETVSFPIIDEMCAAVVTYSTTPTPSRFRLLGDRRPLPSDKRETSGAARQPAGRPLPFAALRRMRGKRFVLPLLTACLAVRLVCPCEGTAVAVEHAAVALASRDVPAPDPHACCRHHSRRSPSRHVPDCPHCNHAQLAAADDLKLPSPSWNVTPVVPVLPADALPSFQRMHARRSGAGGHGPPDTFSISCVLRL